MDEDKKENEQKIRQRYLLNKDVVTAERVGAAAGAAVAPAIGAARAKEAAAV